MKYPLSYHSEVSNDIREAKQWYNRQLKGLDKRFSADVKNCISRILLNPHAHAIRYRNVRTAQADIFPYAIHYFIQDSPKMIVVVAILHERRKPGYADRRI